MNNEIKETNINIRLSKSLDEQARRTAKKLNMPKSEFIRRAIEDAIIKNTKREIALEVEKNY